eukprot:8548804-Alexandrium_andersonii.AAC.1
MTRRQAPGKATSCSCQGQPCLASTRWRQLEPLGHWAWPRTGCRRKHRRHRGTAPPGATTA